MIIDIDWDAAPEWAKYIARDSLGRWYWHELKPLKVPNGFWSYGLSERAPYPKTDMICFDRKCKEVKYD